MGKDVLKVVPLSVLASLLIFFLVFWLVCEVDTYRNVIRGIIYLFVVSISVSFILSIAQLFFPRTLGGILSKVLPFVGNISFLLTPYLVPLPQPVYFLKVGFVVALVYIIFLSLCEVIVRNSSESFSENFFFNIVFSRIFVVSVLGVVGAVVFYEPKMMTIAIGGVITVFMIEEVKRFVAVKTLQFIGKRDMVLASFFKVVSSLKKEVENNTSLLTALRLQLELLSNARKEISSAIESLKQKVLHNVTIMGEYETKYSFLESEMNQIIGNFSTYILSFEYYLAKVRDYIQKVREALLSSHETVSSRIMKKDEVSRLFKDADSVLDSMVLKVDSVVEVLANVLLEENRMMKSMDLVFDEVNALNVISTNVQIEAFRSKSGRTMDTIVGEIGSINAKIRGYLTQVQTSFNKVKELFEYVSLTSQGILKTSDKIKYSIGLAMSSLDSVMEVFYKEVLGFSEIEKKFNEIDEMILSLSGQVKQFRDFLEKLTLGVSLISEVKQGLKEIGITLNDVLVVLEEVQQNVSEG